ncbi:MAG TPA: hypothetical protein VK797_13410, partial [Tepidisphaeraceae bacterium]|nr:hypothetical protein [Tepidisphaeraceae bacterium]
MLDRPAARSPGNRTQAMPARCSVAAAPAPHFPIVKQTLIRKILRPKIVTIFFIQNEFVFDKENLL